MQVGEAGQTAAFRTVLLRGSRELCQNITISPDGNVSYAFPPDLVGVCDVLVTLTDSGGTSNGGADTSDPVAPPFDTPWPFATLGCEQAACGTILRVIVNPVNDAPVLSPVPLITALEYIPGIQETRSHSRAIAVNPLPLPFSLPPPLPRSLPACLPPSLPPKQASNPPPLPSL